MDITLFSHAQRYVGEVLERPGPAQNHPLISWWLSLCGMGFDAKDEVPWCSAFLNGMAWDLRLPRTKSAAARSWLTVGIPIQRASDAVPAWDVVIIKRGADLSTQPGPDVIAAQGHVGVFAGMDTARGQILILGGNVSNGIVISPYKLDAILGIRRLI